MPEVSGKRLPHFLSLRKETVQCLFGPVQDRLEFFLAVQKVLVEGMPAMLLRPNGL